MAVYRRKEGSETWHWCINCPDYPTGDNVTVRHTKPEYGTLCPVCEVKEKARDCKQDTLFSVRK